MSKIHAIKNMPTVYNNTHESIYRSYHTLALVCEMLGRGDSSESIKEVIAAIEFQDKDQCSPIVPPQSISV
jgi:hypothetical protein